MNNDITKIGDDFVVHHREDNMNNEDFGIIPQVFSTKNIDPETDTVILNVKVHKKMSGAVVRRYLLGLKEESAICKKLKSQDISFTILAVYDDEEQIKPEVIKKSTKADKSFDAAKLSIFVEG